MRVLAVLALAVLAGAGRSSSAQGAAEERPDVLFIVLDDLNDWVGCLGGHPQASTPNIDRLAARGVLFTNAHAPAPACNPSRVAVFTGLAPHRSGIYAQNAAFRDSLPDALTLPQRLRALGWDALGAGKIFHKPFPDPDSWREFYPSKDVQIPPDSAKRRLEPVLGGISAAEIDAPGSDLSDGRVAEWVAGVLSDPPDQPLFLACGIQRPHVPWVAPKSAYARFPLEGVQLPPVLASDLDDVPAAALALSAMPEAEPEQARRAVRAYLACTSFADEQVGRVLDALDASPRGRNTIVVLWSDNGFHLGEKRSWSKQTLWEESTHVPLIVVAPGVRPGRCARPVSLQDVFPTVIELCGLEPVAGVDGTSLVPLLADPGAPREEPALSTSGFKNHALRSERWRYVRYADGSEELYDHEADPNEWENVAADPAHAEVKAQLARYLPSEDAPAVAPSRKGGAQDDR